MIIFVFSENVAIFWLIRNNAPQIFKKMNLKKYQKDNDKNKNKS